MLTIGRIACRREEGDGVTGVNSAGEV